MLAYGVERISQQLGVQRAITEALAESLYNAYFGWFDLIREIPVPQPRETQTPIAILPDIGLRVGQVFSVNQVVTEESIKAFADVSGDVNPLHLDSEYARQTRFGGRITHGMYIASLVSAALALMGERDRGRDSENGNSKTIIYRSQTIYFIRPAKIGDTLTATAEITGIDSEGIHALTLCRNQLEKVIMQGEAVVIADPYPFTSSS